MLSFQNGPVNVAARVGEIKAGYKIDSSDRGLVPEAITAFWSTSKESDRVVHREIRKLTEKRMRKRNTVLKSGHLGWLCIMAVLWTPVRGFSWDAELYPKSIFVDFEGDGLPVSVVIHNLFLQRSAEAITRPGYLKPGLNVFHPDWKESVDPKIILPIGKDRFTAVEIFQAIADTINANREGAEGAIGKLEIFKLGDNYFLTSLQKKDIGECIVVPEIGNIRGARSMEYIKNRAVQIEGHVPVGDVFLMVKSICEEKGIDVEVAKTIDRKQLIRIVGEAAPVEYFLRMACVVSGAKVEFLKNGGINVSREK